MLLPILSKIYFLKILAIFFIFGISIKVHAEQSVSSTPGVNPKDNITKTEVIYRYDTLDIANYMQTIALKYDQAFNKNWGGNIEVPFLEYKGFGLKDSGIGDIQARFRYINQIEKASVILGGEAVFPSASYDTLGRGKYQLNPVVGSVFPIFDTSFIFSGYKHLFSIAGKDNRLDINESQPRFIAAYTSKKGWWTLGDLKYTYSWESKKEELDYDHELGMMISSNTGVWTRVGTSFLDSDRNASFLIGIRFLH